MEVSGTFSDFVVDLDVQEKKWSSASVAVTINVKSLTTKNRMRDNHLKSDEFFDVEQFEYITFKSESFYYKGDDVWVGGDLTIKDTSKFIEFPFMVSTTANITTVEANPTLNRFDFGMKANKRTIKKVLQVDIELLYSQD
jgi:polyisoprenoid-binding protein YceI